MKECEKIWASVLDRLTTHVSTAVYDIYFSKLKAVTVKDGVLILSSPMSSIKSGIKKSFSEHLNMAVRESMEKIEGVSIILESDIAAYRDEEVVEEKKEEFNPSMKKITFQKSFTFDNFVIGDSNKYAAAAARAVAEHPGTNQIGRAHV